MIPLQKKLMNVITAGIACVVIVFSFSVPVWGETSVLGGEIPMINGATVIKERFEQGVGRLELEINTSPNEVANFYQKVMEQKGWPSGKVMSIGNKSILMLTNQGDQFVLKAEAKNGRTQVTIALIRKTQNKTIPKNSGMTIEGSPPAKGSFVKRIVVPEEKASRFQKKDPGSLPDDPIPQPDDPSSSSDESSNSNDKDSKSDDDSTSRCYSGTVTLTRKFEKRSNVDTTSRITPYVTRTESLHSSENRSATLRLELDLSERILPETKAALDQMQGKVKDVKPEQMQIVRGYMENIIKTPYAHMDKKTGLMKVSYRVKSYSIDSAGGHSRSHTQGETTDHVGMSAAWETNYNKQWTATGLDERTRKRIKQEHIRVDTYYEPESGKILWVYIPQLDIDMHVTENSNGHYTRRTEHGYETIPKSNNDSYDTTFNMTFSTGKKDEKGLPMDPVWQAKKSTGQMASGGASREFPSDKQWSDGGDSGTSHLIVTETFEWSINLQRRGSAHLQNTDSEVEDENKKQRCKELQKKIDFLKIVKEAYSDQAIRDEAKQKGGNPREKRANYINAIKERIQQNSGGGSGEPYNALETGPYTVFGKRIITIRNPLPGLPPDSRATRPISIYSCNGEVVDEKTDFFPVIVKEWEKRFGEEAGQAMFEAAFKHEKVHAQQIANNGCEMPETVDKLGDWELEAHEVEIKSLENSMTEWGC